MDVLLKYGFEILITQCPDKALNIEEELAMAMGFQQPSIQNTSWLPVGLLYANIDFSASCDITSMAHDRALLQRTGWPEVEMNS